MHANMAILQALIPLSVISNVEDIAGFLGLKVSDTIQYVFAVEKRKSLCRKTTVFLSY